MIYKNDPDLKGEYSKRLVLSFTLRLLKLILAIIAISLGTTHLLSLDVILVPFRIIAAYVLLLAFMAALSYRKMRSQYDEAELELTDEFIEYRILGKKLVSNKILLKDIIGIFSFSNMVDRKQIRIVSKGLVRLIIPSYLKGFEEIKEKLHLAKPDLKGSSAINFMVFKRLLMFVDIILYIAGIIFYRPLLFVSFAILLAWAVFHVVFVCKSTYSKTIKIASCALWAMCILAFSFATFTWTKGIMQRLVFRKVPGEMRLHPWLINEINKYDKNGNLVYHKNFDDENPVEYKKKFDSENREIYYKDLIEKYIEWYDYDSETGLLIHEKFSDGEEYWYEYDSKSEELIHQWDADGWESWNEYDNETGRLLHQYDSAGWESWREYNDEGKVIHLRTTDGYEAWTSYEGGVETYTTSNNIMSEYDALGNIIHRRSMRDDGSYYEYWSEYDSKNEIHTRYNDGREVWKEYDGAGRLLHERWLDGNEDWYEYDENGKNTRHLSVKTDAGTGNKETIDDRYEYNEHGDMTLYEPGWTGADAVYLYDYKYDKAGKRLKSFYYAEQKKTPAVKE
ncbi:MAG: hypothetical protein IJU95_09760 [Treponema sp.]|nr:hypothetical protein [Treponema sp.]